MARIRTIKPEFWTSGQVLECSTNARLLFIGLWNFCDDAGRHPWRPRQIKAEVFPADDFTESDILSMLEELAANDLIRRYAVAGQELFEVTGWHHQRIDKPQSPKHPGPFDDHSRNDPRTIPPDSKGREGKGKERSGSEVGPASPPGSPMMEVGNRVLDAIGIDPAKTTWTFREIQTWLNFGADPERHILPTVADVCRRQRAKSADWQPRGLGYFTGAVREAVESGKRGADPPSAYTPAEPERPWHRAWERAAMKSGNPRWDECYDRLKPLITDKRFDEADAVAREYLEKSAA